MRSMLNEGAQLRPSARTLWEIQDRLNRLPVESASNIYTDVLRRRELTAAAGIARRSAVCDLDSLKSYQQEVRSLFLSCLGGVDKTPLDCMPRITGREQKNGYTLEKVILQPRRGSWATANVYVPNIIMKKPAPAVLVTIGHDDRGKADPEYQYLAQMLVKAGMIVLLLDPLGQGERFEHFELEMDYQPIQGCSGEHDLLDWKAKLLGQSLARYFIQDGICAMDYLASREDVDASRIGLTGHSGGGTQTSMLMMAAGDRFACAAPCCYTSDHRAMMEHGIDPDNEMLWPRSLACGLDYVDLVAGVAPSPVLFLTTQHDFFPREGTLRTLKDAQALWAACGSDHTVDIATATSQHAYPHSLSQAVTKFFMQHLAAPAQDFDTLLADFTFSPAEPSALWCTPEGQVIKYDPAMRTVHDELKDVMLRLKESRAALTEDVLTTSLARMLHIAELDERPEPRIFAEGICGHYQYRSIIWRPQDHYWNSGVFLRDLRQGDKPLPTVIALWPEGTQRLTEHSAWIHRCMQQGYQVLVMDVAASGGQLPARLGNTDMYAGWSTMYNLDAYLMQLDDSFFALRTRQIVAALRMVSAWPEAADAVLYAEKEFSRYADLAALLTNTPIASDDDFLTYEEIVTEKYHDQTWSHAWVLPGALEVFDAPEIKTLLTRKGLSIADPSRAAK